MHLTHSTDHAALMDRTYRHQRLFYDLTRKYYLFGRDRLIAELDATPGMHVLEIACGTGRNLRAAARMYPRCTFYGIDISEQMLTTARRAVQGRAQLAQGDACEFDAEALFGQPLFDRVFISYGLSMIPDWRAAIRMATHHLAPGGQLHVVDFSDQGDLPEWVARAMQGWLSRFHVSPRRQIDAALHHAAREVGGSAWHDQLYWRYAQYGVLRR